MNHVPPDNDQALIQAVIETLEQAEILLTEISDETFSQKVPAAFNASIGGHYRHCLDHFRGVLDATAGGDLNYDHRERGTPVETNRFAALQATRELRSEFELLESGLLCRPLAITCKTSYTTSESQFAQSSIGRELMYSVAHAVHHYALIGIMGGLMGLNMPPGFGIAPSTLLYQSKTATAA